MIQSDNELPMKICSRMLASVACFVIGGLLVAGISGCEVDSASDPLKVKPQSAALLKGESVTLVAEGGYEMTWSLENEEWGMLRPRDGNVVVYTSHYRPEEVAVEIQVVRATSRLWGSGETSGTTTNASPDYEATAEVYISHLRHPM